MPIRAAIFYFVDASALTVYFAADVEKVGAVAVDIAYGAVSRSMIEVGYRASAGMDIGIGEFKKRVIPVCVPESALKQVYLCFSAVDGVHCRTGTFGLKPVDVYFGSVVQNMHIGAFGIKVACIHDL